MNLQTILEILYANNMENVVSLAVRLDNNIDTDIPVKIGSTMFVELYNDNIKVLGLKFASKSSYGYYPVKVIGYSKYRLDRPYLVELPNGETRWTDYKEGKEATATEPINPESLASQLATV